MGRFFRRRGAEPEQPPAKPVPVSPAALTTGVLTYDGGQWAVTWLGEGVLPGPAAAPGLTAAADRAAADLAALLASHPPVPGAELQLAIYPWDFDDGPIFDVEGGPGAFIARDLVGQHPEPVRGAALEELVAAVAPLPGAGEGKAMFRWVRPATALAPAAGAPGASAPA